MRSRVLLVVAIIACSCSSTSTVAIDRTDCVSCHTAPTAAAPLPDPAGVCTPTAHDEKGYDNGCFACHGTTAWCPADANHTRWPITQASDSHAGFDCADCHLSITYNPPAVPRSADITCISCHTHDRAKVDAHHVGNSDYSYGPATCVQLGCHGHGVRP